MPLPFQPIWLEAVKGELHGSVPGSQKVLLLPNYLSQHTPVLGSSQVLMFITLLQSSPLLHKILYHNGQNLFHPCYKSCQDVTLHFFKVISHTFKSKSSFNENLFEAKIVFSVVYGEFNYKSAFDAASKWKLLRNRKTFIKPQI